MSHPTVKIKWKMLLRAKGSLNSSKGVMEGSIIGDTRSLDYSSL